MKSISCALDCVFEILHCVQDDKMKMDFYFGLLYSQTVINQQEHVDGVGRIKLHPPDIVLYFFLVRGEKLLQVLYPFYLFLV